MISLSTFKKNRAQAENVPSRLPVDVVEAACDKGLSQADVEKRVECGWSNTAVTSGSKSIQDIVKENLFTYFNLIFLILAIFVIAVGSFRNLSFMVVIFFNALIGIVQQLRAKKTLEELNMLGSPKATVIRDGKTQTITSEELVRDDIVIFHAGDQVCADAEILTGEANVNESLLTGESDDIVKKTGDSLISGSFVVSGECRARLVKVGADSYISRLTMEAKTMKTDEQSEMLRAMDRLLKVVGIVLIPIGIALFFQSYHLNQETLTKSVTSTVAALVGMIPEGLYLLTSVALAVSSMRLARKKVLLHNMKSIETLARVDVLCVDKTGTITETTMQVNDVIPVNPEAENPAELKRLIGDFVGAMTSDNITMKTLKAHFTQRSGAVPVQVQSFSSSLKYSGVAFADKTYILGAPEFVLREAYPEYAASIEEYTSKGYRLLVLASTSEALTGQPLKEKVTPLAYILLANPIRETAPATFSYFAEQGVQVKVISGDNARTAAEAAKLANIENADRFVDARTLKTENDIAKAVEDYTVFGRVTPEQKRQIVQALKAQGHTVAMTGDGVNDVLALKDADCSVAMASGSDAAAQASQVVLLDSDFSHMPDVVLEGRRVVNNVQRSATLFLVKNLFSFLMSLVSLLFAVTYPLEPSQISLVSTFTIGMPGFLVALQPNKERIQGSFLANTFLRALPAGITDMLAVAVMMAFGEAFGLPDGEVSTVATLLLATVGFAVLLQMCDYRNPLHWFVCGSSIAALLFCCVFLPEMFSLHSVSAKCILIYVVLVVAAGSVFHWLTSAIQFLRQLYQKYIKEKRLVTWIKHLILDEQDDRNGYQI
ncbi:MAG: cation-translocating P-type ATPase [Lachnospiraceae bacterium]|nr:cation-translocating P-type ATPase [Lachnospiraceae bacterium]